MFHIIITPPNGKPAHAYSPTLDESTALLDASRRPRLRTVNGAIRIPGRQRHPFYMIRPDWIIYRGHSYATLRELLRGCDPEARVTRLVAEYTMTHGYRADIRLLYPVPVGAIYS